MKTKFFKKNASVKAGALVRRWRWLRLAMTALLLWPVALSAQNGVTVTNLVLDAGTVTFDVSWDKSAMPMAVWSDTVWVFVDYNDAGKMKRLPLITSGATLTATSAPGVGKVIEVAGNDQGVWVVGNARSAGTFSATVRAGLKPAPSGGSESLHGACAYASNYPPVAEYPSVTNISFTGTPPYALVLKAGGATYSGASLDGSYLVPEGYTLHSFTDKTGAPGVINCILMSGSIAFAVFAVSKGLPVSIPVTEHPSIPGAEAVTYSWLAQGFSPDTYTGTPFIATAPAGSGTYPVTLTAHSMGYCDLQATLNVPVMDCHGGLLGTGTEICAGNDGGKIGI